MSQFANFTVISFIEKHSIFQPNGSKSVTAIKTGDVILMDRQPCRVDKISTFMSKTPRSDSDPSTKSHLVVMFEGPGVLWPKINHEYVTVYDAKNKVNTYSGDPVTYEATLLAIEDNKMTARRASGDIVRVSLPVKEIIGGFIQRRFEMNHKLVIRVASFMGISWVSGYNDHGTPQPSLHSDDDADGQTDSHFEMISESSSSTDQPDDSVQTKGNIDIQQLVSPRSPPVPTQLGSDEEIERFDYEPEDFNLDDFIDNGNSDESEPISLFPTDNPDDSVPTGSDKTYERDDCQYDDFIHIGSSDDIEPGSPSQTKKPDDFVQTGSSNDINPESSCRSTIN